MSARNTELKAGTISNRLPRFISSAKSHSSVHREIRAEWKYIHGLYAAYSQEWKMEVFQEEIKVFGKCRTRAGHE